MPTNTAYWNAKISEAGDAIGAARDAMARTFVGTPAWRAAEEDLNWWQGRLAFAQAGALDAIVAAR